MKIGLLGTGMIVKDFLQGIHDLDFEKVYVLGTEKSKDKTENLKLEYNLDKIFYNYDELLASDIDTVYVALPNMLHYSFAKKAMEYGKNVIIEKPSCANFRELFSLVELARERKLFFMEASIVFYNPMVESMIEDLNMIGDIQIASLNYSQYSSRYDRFKNGEILPVFNPECAGGALMDLNIYNINLLYALFGKPESYSYHANIKRDIDVSGIFVADYQNFKASCIAAKSCKAPTTVLIEGDKGYIVSHEPMSNANSYEICLNDGQVIKKNFYDSKHHRMYHEFKYFIDVIDNNKYELNELCIKRMLDVSEIMTNARLEAGIKFPCD